MVKRKFVFAVMFNIVALLKTAEVKRVCLSNIIDVISVFAVVCQNVLKAP